MDKKKEKGICYQILCALSDEEEKHTKYKYSFVIVYPTFLTTQTITKGLNKECPIEMFDVN